LQRFLQFFCIRIYLKNRIFLNYSTYKNYPIARPFTILIAVCFIYITSNHHFSEEAPMANDVSKQVANCIAMTREVVSSVEHHGSIIIGPLKEVLQKHTSVEIDVAGLLSAVTGCLNSAVTELQDADIALATERTDDPGFRDKRDNALALMTKSITRVKSVLPAGTLAGYGLSGTTPENPDTLINYARKIVTLIKENPQSINVENNDGIIVQINTESIISTLTNCIDTLSLALGDVKREERELQAALELRDAKLAEWKTTYVGSTSVVSGLYQLAGKNDLADRIRPTVRKSSGSGEVVEEKLA
jgi:hypothetical protein